MATISPDISVHDIDIDKDDVLRIIDGSSGILYEYDLSGSLMRQTEIPSICKSCGWVSISSND